MREALLFLLLLVLPACSSSAKQVRVLLRPSADLNGSRSCYVLARAVEEGEFSAESYDDVAAMVGTPDESVQRTVVLLPGRDQEITLSPPEKGRLAFYALLRQPEDDGWRVLLPSPLPDKLELRLDRGRLCWAGDKEESTTPSGRCPARIVERPVNSSGP